MVNLENRRALLVYRSLFDKLTRSTDMVITDKSADTKFERNISNVMVGECNVVFMVVAGIKISQIETITKCQRS